MVWRLPLPHRGRAAVGQLVYRNPAICSERVLEALGAFDEAKVETVLIGGWGIDALGGRQLRPHADLDLLVDEDDFERATATLEGLGYRPWNRSGPGPIGELQRFSVAQTFRDGALRVVELHAVVLERLRTDTGSIGGRPVTCLTPEDQMRSQQLVGRNWTRGQRLKHRSNVAAILLALQQGSQNL